MRVASTIQLGLALLLRGRRAGPARADPGRPAGRQRNPLLGLLRRGPLLRRQLLRPRLPRRPAPLRPVHGADPLRVVSSAPSSRCWSRSACSAASRRSRSGSSPRPSLSLMVVPLRLRPPGQTSSRHRTPQPPQPGREAEDASRRRRSRCAERRRLRGRGAGDHVQRTGLPQRRAADHPRPAGRGGGGLHLQRADDRAGAAAALPGGLDQHPPPPDQPPHLDRARQRARIPPLGADGPARDRRLHRLRRARRPDRRAAADADRLQQEVHLRPRRACCWSRSGWASTSPR